MLERFGARRGAFGSNRRGSRRDPIAVPVAFLALLSVGWEASSVYVVR